MHIEVTESIEQARHVAGQKLDELLGKYEQQAILMLLSGGSAISVLDAVDVGYAGIHTSISMIDERLIESPSQQNYSQFTNTDLYEHLLAKGIVMISTKPQPGDTVESLAMRIERKFRTWRQEHPQGKIVSLLGVGADGHTAGILPYTHDEELFNALFEKQTQWVVGYTTADTSEYPNRVTVNLPFLRTQVDHSVVYAVGQEKTKALERVTAHDGKLHTTPARILQEMKDVTLVTNIDCM